MTPTAGDSGLRALLLLRALPGIGDRAFAQLLADHGSPEAALAADDALGREAAAARRERRILGRVERAAAAIENSAIDIVTIADAAYPARLRQLHVPPAVLFTLGDLSLAEAPGVAVVGTRRATAYGRDAARLFGAGLARAGLTIVSGLARGIDRVAHEAALDAGGATIAVVGSGLDVAYPPENRRLQERIASEGLLLSEFLPGEPPLRHHFPRRNRIIAALAEAVLVVEAGPTSGAFGTVEHALELGRDVFAVPGPIGRDSSAGTHQLIQEGAGLVTAVPDVLVALAGAGAARQADGRHSDASAAVPSGGARVGTRGRVRRAHVGPTPAGALAAGAANPTDVTAYPATVARTHGLMRPGHTTHTGILRALGVEPRHIDDVAAAVGESGAAVLASLLELELDGWVRQLPGMRFAARI